MRRPDPGTRAWLDGRRIAVDGPELPAVLEPWAQTGLGAFETVGVRDGAALDVRAHLGRLAGAAAFLGIRSSDEDELAPAVAAVAASIEARRGWVKIVAHRDGPVAVFGGRLDDDAFGAPATAVVLPWRRHAGDALVGLKTTSWAASILGAEEARRRGADEGLWLNHRGHLTESCGANLFVVRGRRLFTAEPRDGILPGIVRGHVLAVAREIGMTVHEGKVRRTRIRDADEAFLTSSVRGVRALVAVDDRAIGGGGVGPWTAKLAAAVDQRREPDSRRDGTLDNARVGG